MKITIEGKPNKLTRQEVIEAVNIFSEQLMSSRLRNTLEINIHFKYMTDYKGLCVWLFDNHRPKDYEIIINNAYGKKTQLMSLAHELVHVKQWATGQMKDLILHSDTVRYNDKYYNVENENYYFTPWEVEAYGLEIGLYEQYKQRRTIK